MISNQAIKKSREKQLLAEREGFEPPVRLRTTVFKTVAIDHSAISPGDWFGKRMQS